MGFSLDWVRLAVVRSLRLIDRAVRRSTHAALGCRKNRCLESQVCTDIQPLVHIQPEGNTGGTPLEGILEGCRCKISDIECSNLTAAVQMLLTICNNGVGEVNCPAAKDYGIFNLKKIPLL